MYFIFKKEIRIQKTTQNLFLLIIFPHDIYLYFFNANDKGSPHIFGSCLVSNSYCFIMKLLGHPSDVCWGSRDVCACRLHVDRIRRSHAYFVHAPVCVVIFGCISLRWCIFWVWLMSIVIDSCDVIAAIISADPNGFGAIVVFSEEVVNMRAVFVIVPSILAEATCYLQLLII